MLGDSHQNILIVHQYGYKGILPVSAETKRITSVIVTISFKARMLVV